MAASRILHDLVMMLREKEDSYSKKTQRQLRHYCYYDQVSNKTLLKFGCLPFLLKRNNTKVYEKS